MALFRFVVIGSPQAVVLDVDAAHLDELHATMSRSRFVRGQMATEHCDGLSLPALLATSRVQMVTEVS